MVVKNVCLLVITLVAFFSVNEVNGEIECGVRYSSKVEQRKIALKPTENEKKIKEVKGKTIDGRIVGGKPAITGDFPWLVSVQRDGAHFCGGSIISPMWILTASHCYKDHESEIENLSVVTGATVYDKGDRYTVKEVITHESFQFVHYSNDVALIHLTSPITYKSGINGVGAVGPICLPSETSNYEGTATVAGWGYLYNGAGVASKKLMAVDVNILEPENCVKAYRIFNENTMLCAGYPEGKKDACQGDSGGGLIGIIKNRAVQVGIVSYGEGCAMRDKPGVYTRLTNYIKWIDDQIDQRDGDNGFAKE